MEGHELLKRAGYTLEEHMDESAVLPFPVGAVVRLKSGGPSMTVLAAAEGRCLCCWFREGVPKNEDFPVGALNLVPNAEKTD